MLTKGGYPITEFDDSRTALINPKRLVEGTPYERLGADKLVITFFPEVIAKLIAEGKLETACVIPGENDVVLYRFTEEPGVLLMPGQVGCPACAGNLDLVQATGIAKVMFCGGGGALDSDIGAGELLVVEGAIRDEGFSYHYVAPSRVIESDPSVTDAICRFLEARNIPHVRGLTWTTDALFRETPDRIAVRRAEGARIVEMEQAGCLAVAKFRGFDYGALIYSGDDVSGEAWDERGWRSREGIRYDLVTLCRQLVRVI